MSLRSRVLIAIALVLVLTAAFGAVLAGLRAHASLEAELGASMQGASRSLGAALRDSAGEPQGSLQQLVSTFDGDRHVRVLLRTAGGVTLFSSQPFIPAHVAPRWFAQMIDPKLAAARLAVPGQAGAMIELRPAPEADLADSWLNFSDLLIVLCLACLLGCGLVFLLIGQALHPLDLLIASFDRIGRGDYRIRLEEGGAKEIASIGHAFNHMAGQLMAMQGRNRLLEEQLIKLQDEERAELARDLHDDVGPYLFAVNVDAAMINQLAAAKRIPELQDPVRSIQTNVAHMQARVRDILGRLRPTRVVELGLEPAIADLVEFWKARSPGIDFALRMDLQEERLTDDAREAAYRVVQEGLSNAVRHGRPTRIDIDVSAGADAALTVRVHDDGSAGPAGHPRREPGFGLVGMRERVAQAGGVLTVEHGQNKGGWTVTAKLPMARRRRARRTRAAA